MKNLLIPVDFSDAARNAFHYAMAMAQQAGFEKATLAHVFLPESAGEADYIPPVHAIMQSRRELLNNFFNELKKAFDGEFPVPVEPELLVGFPADEIAKQSELYDMIVMGTTGESGLLERVFGSVSSSVSQRAYCPVLLVPETVTYQPLKNLVYASHYDTQGEAVISRLMDFNRLFNAHLHFVHVKREKDAPLEVEHRELFDKLFQKGAPPFSFDIAEVAGDSVPEGLNQYAKANNAQLIVMATRHRSFWDNILHRSQTKRMALSTAFPLMVLHLDVE
mgnify:CR=1 FL=1